MRAKFIRGMDPKDTLGLGIQGEILQVGYTGTDNFQNVPIKQSDSQIVLLLNNWTESIDDDYVFDVRLNNGDKVYLDPDDMEGKTWLYSGGIYSLPS